VSVVSAVKGENLSSIECDEGGTFVRPSEVGETRSLHCFAADELCVGDSLDS
jgi:hypothetical protein